MAQGISSKKSSIMLQKIKSISTYIQKRINCSPEIAVILGTGLGGLDTQVEVLQTIPYEDIPDFPVSTVEGHKGQLLLCSIGPKKILAMQGRFHYYEGYTMEEVTLPIRVFKALGIETLIVSNASGGLNPDYKVGDIMVISDHINMFGTNPLIGPNLNELGPRFPSMNAVYDLNLITKVFKIATEKNISLREGVYVGVSGPTYETPAEYRMYRLLGGDAIGMSTVPEVIVAKHMGMRVFGLSIVTDSGAPGEIKEITHEEVQQVAKAAEPVASFLIKELIACI
jgi:purine-nucleoside phosphorylase